MSLPPDDRRCKYIKEDGSRCKAWAKSGSEYCNRHAKHQKPDEQDLDDYIIATLEEMLRTLQAKKNPSRDDLKLMMNLATNLDKALERREARRQEAQVPYRLEWPDLIHEDS